MTGLVIVTELIVVIGLGLLLPISIVIWREAIEAIRDGRKDR